MNHRPDDDTSVNTYETTRRNIPGGYIHTRRRKNLKSQKTQINLVVEIGDLKDQEGDARVYRLKGREVMDGTSSGPCPVQASVLVVLKA
jgi:hypothetical protein